MLSSYLGRMLRHERRKSDSIWRAKERNQVHHHDWYEAHTNTADRERQDNQESLSDNFTNVLYEKIIHLAKDFQRRINAGGLLFQVVTSGAIALAGWHCDNPLDPSLIAGLDQNMAFFI